MYFRFHNIYRCITYECLVFIFIDSITKETLRMNSGVFMVRAVTEDTWFQMRNGKSYKIRKGDKVAMYPPAIHKDAEIYENPDVSFLVFFQNFKMFKNLNFLVYKLP